MPFFPLGLTTGGPYQPLNGNLTQISEITPSTNGIMQYKAGAWDSRTLTQVWQDFMADPGVGAYAYTALPFTITTDKRLLGRDSALPPFTASEISIGTGLMLSSSTLSLDATAVVTSITGTANEVLVNGGSGAAVVGPVTLTLPQRVDVAAPAFQVLRLGIGGAAHGTLPFRSLGNAGAVASPPTYSSASTAVFENNDSAVISLTSASSGYPEFRFYRSGDTSPRVAMYADLPTDAFMMELLGAIKMSLVANGAWVPGLAVGPGLAVPSEEIQLGNNRAVRFSNASGGVPSYGQLYVDSSDNMIFYLNGAPRLTVTASGLMQVDAIQTSSPSGGTAQPWKLGNYTAGAAAQAGKVRVEINGVSYDILTA